MDDEIFAALRLYAAKEELTWDLMVLPSREIRSKYRNELQVWRTLYGRWNRRSKSLTYSCFVDFLRLFGPQPGPKFKIGRIRKRGGFELGWISSRNRRSIPKELTLSMGGYRGIDDARCGEAQQHQTCGLQRGRVTGLNSMEG